MARREIDTDASAEALGGVMFIFVDVGLESKKACQ